MHKILLLSSIWISGIFLVETMAIVDETPFSDSVSAAESVGFDFVSLECEGDPLSFAWMQTLLSTMAGQYCDSCLTVSQAFWMDMPVIEVNWNAADCGISDSGFWTVYSCAGDTLQHCQITIAGQTCVPEPAELTPEELSMRETIWRCEIAACLLENDSILCQSWLIDSLSANADLCDLACIEGNSGNFVYRHDLDERTLIEFRTTCGTIIRNFFDCSGSHIFTCNAFDFGFGGTCDTSAVPGLMDGELLWDCSMPIKGSTAMVDQKTGTIEVFPTIFNHWLGVRVPGHQTPMLFVTDQWGRQVLRTSLGAGEIHLNTSDWVSGAYFLTFGGKDQKVVRRVIKTQ